MRGPPGIGDSWRRWSRTLGIPFVHQPKITLMSFREELEEAFRLFDREGDGQIEAQVHAAFLQPILWNENKLGRS